MKRCIILLFVMVLLLTSCNVNPLDSINTILSTRESERIKQMSTDILTCITENDKESFKKLFCERTQNSPDFDKQVDKAFEYCKGTVYFTDTTIKTIASGGSSANHGRRTQWHVYPEIPYFRVLTDTDSGDTEFRHYSIQYVWYIINEEDTTLEGLHSLEIELLNVDSMTIGE